MNIAIRILIAAIGIVVGVIMFHPNAMMCASGTKVAEYTAYCGMLASVSFVIGGIVGAICSTWYGLLPGLLLQILVFFIPTLFRNLHETQLKAMTAKYNNNNESTSTANVECNDLNVILARKEEISVVTSTTTSNTALQDE